MTNISLDREALALFEALLEAAPADADAWLAEKTASRPELLSRVRALLAAETQASLKTGGAVRAVDQEGPPPERLAGYAILERIGAGGMGSVYLGRRDRGDFDHVAAIKVIRPGLLSQRLVDRFRRERQILAQLRHPNIAQLYDGGETEDGSPYIIMEYVDGQPLLAWAEASGASRAERIDKLEQACSAVAFAHANLIVHRDITPSNVLVTAGGMVKLIDFGIARPAGEAGSLPQPSGGSSLHTLSLTPGYAAPERMTGVEPTTAADVYSLGKLAEKLLADAGDDPELAAIVAKATAQAPKDRHAAADLLAADIRDWRDGYPVKAYVAAQGGGRGYVLRKFLGRHRVAAWASGIGAAVLAAAFVATGVSWVQAEQARAAEARRFADVRALATYMLFDLNEQLRTVPGNTTAREDLAARAQTYLDALAASEGASRDLKFETAQGLVRLAEIQNSPLDRNLGYTTEAQANLEKARRLLAEIATTSGDRADLAVTEARIEAMAGLIAFYEDTDPATSLALFAKGRAALERVGEGERDAAWRLALRDISKAEMERMSANEQFEELVAAADAHEAMVAGWPAAEQQGDPALLERAWAIYYRGLAWSLMEREAEGYPAMRQAHDMYADAETRAPGNSQLLYMIGWSGADAYAAAARLDKAVEAEDLLTSAQRATNRLTAIEDRDQSALMLWFMVGEAYSQHLANVGRFDEAIAEQQRIVDMRIAELDETSSGANAAWAEMILGRIGKQAGRRDVACAGFASAEARFTKADAMGRLIEFHRAFLPGLRANLAACAAGTRISDFPPLR